MVKKIVWIAAVTCSLAFSASTFASPCRDSLEKMVDSLSLAKEQSDKLKPIMMQFKTTMKDKAAMMKDLDMQIKKQESSSTMEEATVNGLVDKKAALIGDMMKAKVQAKHQVMDILNPEQRMVIQNKMEKMEKKMAERYAACHND